MLSAMAASLWMRSPTCLRPRLHRRNLGHEPQRYREAFQLVVRSEPERRTIVTGIALDLLALDLGGRKRLLRLRGLRGIDGIAVDVLHDPLVEPLLHRVALLEGADLVAHDALQVVREATTCKEVRQPG